MSFCKNCGKPLGVESKFCPVCGARSSESPPATEASEFTRSRPLPARNRKTPDSGTSHSLRIPLAVGLAVIGIAGLLLILFFALRSGDSPSGSATVSTVDVSDQPESKS